MNWLLIIIVLLLALCVVNGYRKGFLRMMYSMVSWVIMFALVTWATPYINTFLRDNTSIYQTIAVYCEQQIREKTAKQIEQEAAAVPGEAADETQPAAGQQAEGVEQNNGQPADLTKLGVKLPDSVMYQGFRLSAESTSISELLREPYTALWLSGLLFM